MSSLLCLQNTTYAIFDKHTAEIMKIPEALIRSLKTVKGFDEAAFRSVHHSGEQITSIRENPFKFNIRQSAFKIAEKIPWCANGYYLHQRPSFTLDPLFHAGAYYVQDASSMFLEQVIRQTLDLTAPLKILDLCAAPGGKSTLIQSLISAESLLVSNEVIKTRVTVLAENISKWGAANVVVTNNDPRDFQRLGNYFDAIVVDAPCSGSGLFRKDPEAISAWSESNVLMCSQRQQRILADVLPALKAAGVLIYSTCSYSKEEDEEMGDWLANEMEMDSLGLEIPSGWNIIETLSDQASAKGYRFYPDKLKGEGFFLAAFRKKAIEENSSRQGKKRNDPLRAVKKEIEAVSPWLNTPGNYFFFKQNDEIRFMPIALEPELEKMRSALYIKKAGVKLGTLIRDELIPDHELALYPGIHASVKRMEVDLETARQYLRKEEIRLSTTDTGWMLITHGHLPLGWVKVMPNRINNYYPAAWRILNK